MARILIVEDDPSINRLLVKSLTLVGHSCYSVEDGEAVFPLLIEQDFDVILLDLMLPKRNGFDVLASLPTDIPVIVVTARSAVADRVKGLRLGADDYLIKPFDMTELQARVESLLRRTHKADERFELDGVLVDLSSRQVFLDDTLIDVTPQEFLLVEALITNRNIALSRERLLDIAWGYDFGGDTRTVDVHIHSIRKKLGWENVIKTVYKLGYRLEARR